MTKDSPSHSGKGPVTSKKPCSPVPAVVEEQRGKLEKLRAELEAERARGREERRRFTAQARQLREAAERERQQLVDHLRSKWEAQCGRELRQLQEEMLREREAEIRQLLRWKEAELRQLQQLLHRERDDVVRQARELQRQLAEELVSRGYCGRAGAPEVAAAQCRCRLQEVLALLRWETDGEQASRIRHLQATLDVERQLFLKYILEHFRWHPALSSLPDSQTTHSSEAHPPKTASSSCGLPESACLLEYLQNLSTDVRVRSRSVEVVPTACSNSPDSLLPTCTSSLHFLTPSRSCSLDSTLTRPKSFESEERASSSRDPSILGFPSPTSPPPPPPSPPSPLPSPSWEHRRPSESRGNSRTQPCETLTRSSAGLDYHELMKQNSELSQALQVLARRCSDLQQENLQLRDSGFPDQADEKVKRLKSKNAELTGLARRLEDRARKLQEANLPALSAPGLGDSGSGLELYQVFALQLARDRAEQARELLAKDKQIEQLRLECHLLQAHFASDLGSAQHSGGVTTHAQWLNVNDLDRLQRESQREVLRLQKQLTLQQGTRSAQGEAGGQSAWCEEARRQILALELELCARRQECEELGAEAAAARRRGEETEEQLQATLHQGARLAKENAWLQAQADRMRKVAAEINHVRRQLGSACLECNAAGPLVEQLQKQPTRGQDRQQQLQHDLQKALCDLQVAQEDMYGLHGQPDHSPQKLPQVLQVLVSQERGSDRTKFLPGPEDQVLSQSSNNKQEKRETSLLESPVAPQEPTSVPQMPDRALANQLDSKPQTKKISSQSNSSSEVESMWATVPSCSNLEMDTASEVDDLEPDSVSLTLEMGDSEAPDSPKLKIFLTPYGYNPFEGPNEHPESEQALKAEDYAYIFGGMDENGFYEGELKDGRQGLAPSNLVEQIPDGEILGYLPTEPSDLGLIQPPVGQGKAWKEDTGHRLLSGKAQGDMDRKPCQVVRAGSKTEVTEISDAETEAGRLGFMQDVEEQGFSRPLLGAKVSLDETPMQLHLRSIAATSAEVTWVSSSSSHPHMVYLNDQEHALIPVGVNCYTFYHLHPSTRYQVRVEVWLPWDLLQVHWKVMSSTITFTTPLAGPPDPPLDVLVERHTSPDLLMISWLPVTIDSAGSSNGVRVTGYAVYADGLKVLEVSDATAGSTLLEFSQLQRSLICQKVSVRTMSLCGESLDSVPAQIPQDCFTCLGLPDMSPFSYTCGDLSTCRATFSVCTQRLALTPLNTEVSPHTLGSCGEPWVDFLEAFSEEPPRRPSPVPTLSSEGDCPNGGSDSQVQEYREAWEVFRKDLLFRKGLQNHRPCLSSVQSGGEDHGLHLGTSKNHAPGLIHMSFECRPKREPSQEKSALAKILKEKQDNTQVFTSPKLGTSQQYVCDFHNISQEEEAVCFSTRGTERQEQRKELRTQSRRGQALWGKRKRQLQEPSSALCPVLSSKVIQMSRSCHPPLGPGADIPARVFVALFDYDPLGMSASPEAAEEELAFKKGQLLRVWGSRDPQGLYHADCNGQVGNIPGHMVAEVEVGTECTDGRWHLLAQGPLPSVAHLNDFGGLGSPQGSFSVPQGTARQSLMWTSKTMIAILDYDPKNRQSGGQMKDKLSLKAGDVVTVYGTVDDKGFYYAESSGHRGLVPAYLLDHMSLHGEQGSLFG